MPGLKLIKRENESILPKILVPLLAIILAFLSGAIFLSISGFNPGETYIKMFTGAFGSTYALAETIVKAIPLMLAGLAVSLAFRMKLWNIGAEGQIYMGAFAASGLALSFGNLSPWFLLPLMMLAGFTAGGIWGLIPGALRAFWEVNETIITLMLNYIAIFWVDFLVFGPWKDPESLGFPLTPRFSPNAYLPALGDTRVHMGLLIAIAIAVLFFLLIKYTRWGYEIRVIGESRAAAHYAGMDVIKNILLVMAISGGIAGLAGMIEVSGITHRLQPGISPGYGYTAIIVAWLGRLDPFAIIVVAFLFGALLIGGFNLQSYAVPFSIVLILQGAVLFFLLAGEIFMKYRLSVVRKEDQ
ncbi:MAG: ABC transporter permease [Syntrophomonadaceae bacterium]|nr:ABC transporter permease [Syntrophomonadaceae bacterium]MDD3889516.1 ABC transporter permease [Syntrophomonadaceae bacterium]MDD4548768.1 ABC transporter permease [Syntrophomonadaceae bacterium]